MAKISIWAAIVASFAFTGVAWRRAAAIMVVVVAATAGAAVLQRMMLREPLISFCISVGLLFVGAAVVGALLRIGLADGHAGDPDFAPHFGGLQWGGLEWRVVGSSLLVGVIFTVLSLVVIIVWAIALGMWLKSEPQAFNSLAYAKDQAAALAALLVLAQGPAGLVSGVILIPASAALLYAAARISLYTVQAADTRSFDLGRAWSLADGGVWALFLGMVTIYIAEFLLGAAGGAAAGVVAGATGHHAQGSVWGNIAGQTLGAAISAPLLTGLQLYVYRAKTGAPNVAEAFA